MKLLVGLVCAAQACFGLAACPPPSPAPAPPDAQDGAPAPPPPNACVDACARARAFLCPEGAYADCSLTCARVLADPHMAKPDLGAIAAAPNQAAVRAAGWTCRSDGGP